MIRFDPRSAVVFAAALASASACIGALDGAIASFRERAAAHVGKHGAKTAEVMSNPHVRHHM